MVDAINPILLSTPYLVIISVATANEALPDIGLNKARGTTSLGNPILFVKKIIHLLSTLVVQNFVVLQPQEKFLEELEKFL